MRRRLEVCLYWLGIALLATAVAPAVGAEAVYWNIKGIHPKGHLLDIKAATFIVSAILVVVVSLIVPDRPKDPEPVAG